MKMRRGDTIKIGGDYQYRALTEGNAVQRFWHFSKLLAIQRYLPPSSKDHVLDVGCGSGVVSDFLGNSAAEVLAIDANEDAIAFATQKFARANVKFKQCLVDDFVVLVDHPLDKIYCLELIEHIHFEQTLKLFKMFLALLKPGGKVFVTTPNYNSLWPLIEWFMDAAKLAPPMAEHQHVQFFHPSKLRELGRTCGFDIETTSSMCFLAPWMAPFSWSLAKRINALESHLPFRLGCVVVCVFAKPKSEGSG